MRIAIAVVVGVVVAVVLDQLLPGGDEPSLADSMRYGVLVAVLTVVVARKAVKDRERSEARGSEPT